MGSNRKKTKKNIFFDKQKKIVENQKSKINSVRVLSNPIRGGNKRQRGTTQLSKDLENCEKSWKVLEKNF